MKIYRRPIKQVRNVLQEGGVGVMPTDTIYGFVGSALNIKTVQRIYKLRRRSPKKPMIVLIGSLTQLKIFGVNLDKKTERFVKKFWPGKVSIILQRAKSKEQRAKFKYLHRGTNTLAFRLPKPQWLRRLLTEVGPLVAPSANFEGKPPATSINQAKKYFGNGVDFYVDGGIMKSLPSMLVKIERGAVTILRQGEIKI